MFSKKYTKNILIFTFLQIIYSLLNSYLAIIIKTLTDSLTMGNFEIFKESIKIAIITVIGLILSSVVTILFKNNIVTKYMVDIKNNSMNYFFNSDRIEITDDKKSKFYSYLTNELNILENSSARMELEIIGNIILLLISGITVIYFNILFLPIIVFIIVFLAFAPILLKNWIQKASVDRISKYEDFMTKSKNYIDLFYIINVYDIKDKILSKFKDLVDDSMNSKKDMENKIGIANGIISFLNILVTLIVYILGGYLIFNNIITIGVLIAVIQLMTNITIPLTNILASINEINSTTPIKEYYNNLIENRNPITACLNINNFFPITLQNISYENEGKKILNSINLNIEEGKNYIIIGPNGSGKSTLTKIISGIITGYKGEIKIDGNPYNNHYLNTIYISKDNQLFEDNVDCNLTLYDKIAYKKDYIKKFKLDDNFLKKEKNQLSDGEKQKLIYMRSLAVDKNLTIYDEPDSSLDSISKKIIIEDILNNGKTNIIISHSSDDLLYMFDEIWYLENGNLEIYSTYEEYRSFRDKSKVYSI